ncbi:DUF4123 domain-containing protein [Paraburkholderia dinghuensis]|uniref:DUF4123 domain-containing protein n=1 Tax=Paraburkholderia dinghuensis TaxID=2305225 RepID=A0A3N6NS47_9BURK|nr:DUF4123 domain-containing protein [Paraburkholderia dinghuensis]RQH02993.1 DUF4123 domain-containing protein [Paraburkholderia dinghuensis]
MQYPQTNGPATDEDAQIESLNGALTGWFSRHREKRCLLAVDPSQRDLSSEDADGDELFACLPRSDVLIDHDAFPEARRPYLLELDLSTQAGVAALAQSVRVAFEDRRPESMAEGLGQRVGGWMASAASLDEVAAHWSRLALQRDESGRNCVLRFYDSRSLALLWTVFSQAQQQALLGPVRAWHVLDAGARPSVHVASRESRTSFALSSAQWQAVHRHGLINRALALHARACDRQPEPGEIEAAVAAAARAERCGLIDRDDRIAFIGHALSWHPQFDLHPTVLQLLRHRAADDFYTGEIGQLTADEIEEIRQGSWYECLGASAVR